MNILTNASIPVWAIVVTPIAILIVGFIIGFFVARAVMKKYLEKNPPINENMIRAMMQQMGRTPSEKQVRAVMREMQQNKNK